MEENRTKASALLTCAGTLLLIAGVLMGISVRLAYGGMLWAGASTMFFAAYSMKKEGN